MHLFRQLQSKIEPNFRQLKQFGKTRNSSLGEGDSILNDIHHPKNIKMATVMLKLKLKLKLKTQNPRHNVSWLNSPNPILLYHSHDRSPRSKILIFCRHRLNVLEILVLY